MDHANGNPLMAKVQALVSADDKRTVLASLGGDDGVLTFVIQYAFKHAADYIRSNHLNTYDPANYIAIVEFIRNGAYPRSTGPSPSHPHPRTTEGSERTAPSTSSEPTARHKDRARRIRERAKILVEHAKEGAGER
jgi:hypothetical protein